MTIRERMEIAKKIKSAADAMGCELRDDQLDPAQLSRLLALVEAAEKCVADYRDAENEQYDENKWAEFAGTDSVEAALSALREHGDI
jgi:hypothetical protein